MDNELRPPDSVGVYLGHTNIDGNINKDYLFYAEKFIVHEKYRTNYSFHGQDNDIALIKLDRKIDFDGLHKGTCKLMPTNRDYH